MTVPRDFKPINRTGWVRIGRHFSNVVSPPTLFAALGLVLAVYERPDFTGLVWGVGHGLTVSLAPILFVLWLLRTGRIAELHMSNQRERNLPYLVTIGCAIFFMLLTILWDGPELLACLAAVNGITVAALALINFFWLISIHTTSAMAAAAIVGVVFGVMVGLVMVLLAVMVAAGRVYLKRHTPAQVTAGLLFGAGIVWAFTWFGCFVS